MDLKTQLNILFFTLMLGSVFLYGCTEKSGAQTPIENSIEFKDFDELPNYPFLELSFGLTRSENVQLLEKNDFGLTTNSYYERNSDSTLIILPSGDDLSEFKLYLKSDFYLENSQHLFALLSGSSTKFIGTSTFAEMSFEGAENPFALTYFTTNNYIRIFYKKL